MKSQVLIFGSVLHFLFPQHLQESDAEKNEVSDKQIFFFVCPKASIVRHCLKESPIGFQALTVPFWERKELILKTPSLQKRHFGAVKEAHPKRRYRVKTVG